MKKIWNWIKQLFAGAKYLVEKYVRPSVLLVEQLKKAVDSPAIDILTTLIPGTIDDKIAAILRRELPRVLKVLKISEECVSKPDPGEVIVCAVKALRDYSPDGRAAAYHSIAALLAHYSSSKGSKSGLSWGEAVHLAEVAYRELKQPEAA